MKLATTKGRPHVAALGPVRTPAPTDNAPTFSLGGRWPEGPDEGADERGITPVGTLISLASLDSFPLEGGSLFA